MKLGVFTPVFGTLTLDEVIPKVQALKHVHALELGTGGWPGKDHLDVDALLDKKPCADTFRKKIADAGLTISALSCHNNPLHPDAAIAKEADDVLRKTVRLAEQLEVPVVVTFVVDVPPSDVSLQDFGAEGGVFGSRPRQDGHEPAAPPARP